MVFSREHDGGALFDEPPAFLDALDREDLRFPTREHQARDADAP